MSTEPTEVHQIPLDLIDPGPADARRLEIDPEELRHLAGSIARDGVLCPIHVAARDDRYVTLAGRRRRDAARLAGLTTIPALILSDLQDDGYKTSAIENLYRANLTPLEEAGACAAAIQDHGYTVAKVAQLMGHSEKWVKDKLDMLDWPDDVLAEVHNRRISVAAAAPLSQIREDDTRTALLAEATRQGASARTTSAWLQAHRYQSHGINPQTQGSDPEAPPSTPAIPHAHCWACGGLRPVSSLSYLPTCGACYSAIPPAVQAACQHDTSAPAGAPPPTAPQS